MSKLLMDRELIIGHAPPPLKEGVGGWVSLDGGCCSSSPTPHPSLKGGERLNLVRREPLRPLRAIRVGNPSRLVYVPYRLGGVRV